MSGFEKEIESLLKNRSDGKPGGEGELDSEAKALHAANGELMSVIKPLCESYAGVLKNRGRACDYKIMEANIESFPRRRPAAEFYVGLLGVPGLSEYYMRFENDGSGWLLTSRPRLDGNKASRFDSGKIAIKSSDKLSTTVESLIQNFIRLTI